MISQIFIGSALIALTILIEAGFIGVAVLVLRRIRPSITEGRKVAKLIAVTTTMTLWMLGSLSVAVWVWATAFISLGQFDAWEEALYFSVVTFTTLGFGDILLDDAWRILSGLAAANGLILFSLTTAFLIAAIKRLTDDFDRSL